MKKEKRSYYSSLLKLSYFELCSFLQKKHGESHVNYFHNNVNWNKNPRVARSSEGLECHHVMEYYSIMLSNKEYAIHRPWEWQLAKNLVYADLLEHLILHIKIVEETFDKENEFDENTGIGGVLNFFVPKLNDYYSGFESDKLHIQKQKRKIESNYSSYLDIMKYFKKLLNKIPREKVNYFQSVFTSFNASFMLWNWKNNSSVFLDLEKLGFDPNANEKNLIINLEKIFDFNWPEEEEKKDKIKYLPRIIENIRFGRIFEKDRKEIYDNFFTFLRKEKESIFKSLVKNLLKNDNFSVKMSNFDNSCFVLMKKISKHKKTKKEIRKIISKLLFYEDKGIYEFFSFVSSFESSVGLKHTKLIETFNIINENFIDQK